MKKTLLAIAVITASSSAVAGWTSEDGRLSIGGDAEINFDAFSNKNGVTGASIPTRDDRGNTSTQLNDDSRILMDVTWRDTREDGSYIQATAQPLFKANGNVEMDDAFFAFGREDSWDFQIGRFEAMDLFPLGKDIAMFYAAGGDEMGGGVYYYMAKEGRGRRGDAGQARIAGHAGNWTTEISTVYGNTADVLGVEEGGNIKSKHNSFMVRPAVNYLSDSGTVSISFGGEYEANSDSVLIKNDQGKEFDLSDRYGLSATATLTFGDLVWHNSAAYQDAKELHKAQTFNSNIEYNAFGLGASYAKNKYTDRNKGENYAAPKSYLVYTSYTVPVLNFHNAEVTFALSHSKTENAYGTKGNDEKTTAFRTRFNYYF
ncbi:carbohydrate porin [Endozoicomonas lisbonensis]|uniref:Porin n=1 Tax=Endozoicomonas lisbonensis TaxID=3120522 RepID=A0ABV2SFV6_9GAMM